jgi:hypothetical protein
MAGMGILTWPYNAEVVRFRLSDLALECGFEPRNILGPYGVGPNVFVGLVRWKLTGGRATG